MAHRAATDEICVAGGYGERPIKQKAGTRQSLRLVSFGSKRPCLPKPAMLSSLKLFSVLYQFHSSFTRKVYLCVERHLVP